MEKDITQADYYKQENEYLREALEKMCQDLIRAGMAEYKPNPQEMIELGKWGLGLIKLMDGITKEYGVEW